MKHGFVKVAAATPTIKVADTTHNGMVIRSMMREAEEEGAKIVVFPELCITGYTCGDLFFQDRLIQSAKEELVLIAKESEHLEGLFFVGLPFEINGKLYDVAAAVSGGEVLGIVPKINLAGYQEFSEGRYFASGEFVDTEEMLPNGQTVLITTDLLFCCPEFPRIKVAAELCEDLWVPSAPSVCHTMAGATIVVNLAASDELAGKDEYQRNLIMGQSGRLLCGYVFASAGEGESTQDVVYSGRNYIAENGSILKESKPFENGIIYSEIDVERLEADRRRRNTYEIEDTHMCVPFHLSDTQMRLTRCIEASPFVPTEEALRKKRCEDIFMIQAMGLKKRMEHTHAKSAVIGISGGLDSTLALLVMVKAFDLLKKDRKDIIAVTMPGFGTTDRTYDNAVNMIQCVGASFMEISIKNAVTQHFADIGHDSNVHDVTYENAQARERTQILMDIANRFNGMVIGTGDMSELALGWATYNGDHMSMYGVNGSIPKTLVRHLVRYYADVCGDEGLSAILLDVLDTPVSPELLPPENGEIAQKTEDLVGPYELHDFFLYYVLRFGFTPEKIYRLAKIAFHGIYEDAYILKWMKTFYRRFFTQQFKRSCLPDGPKVGSLSVSPRGDLRMPSDACARIWLDELEALG
uniref:NAD(+) synthase n=1 Tax=Agathobacter sp. TaxID=2021311 RepID=UPI0040561B1E